MRGLSALLSLSVTLAAATASISNETPINPTFQRLLKHLYTDKAMWESTVYENDHKLMSNGVDTTYGEILPESVANISAQFKSLNQSSTEFWDLGSGVGRMVIQEFLEDDWKRAVGVELVKVRYDVAATALSRLILLYYDKSSELGEYVREKVGPGARRTENRDGANGEEVCFGNADKEICLFNEDMTIVPGLENAGGVFMCSTCFPEKLLKTMMDKRFSKMAPGSIIMSLKSLPQADLSDDGMELVATEKHDMTWMEEDTVDVYKRLQDKTVITERAHVMTL